MCEDLVKSMATSESPTSGEPDRTTSRGTAEERDVTLRGAAKLDVGAISKEDRRIYHYRHIGVLNSLCTATKAVWHIRVDRLEKGKETNSEGGTCFLGKFDVTNPRGRPHVVHGLFTAYHVLGEEAIRYRHQYRFTISNRGLPLDKQRRNLPLRINKSTFCFTCPLLDVTFIEFDEQLIDEIIDEHKLDFLHVYTGWCGPEGTTEFHILQYPCGSDQHFGPGHLERYHGLHLFHSVSTEKGSSGSPVLIADDEMCHVVAIHTAASESSSGNYNVAVSNKSIFTPALIPAWEAREGEPVSHHPNTEDELKKLDEKYNLKSLGLQLQKARSKVKGETPRIPFYFKHPGLRVSDVEVKVPIYFVLTSHGWYWSAVAPDNGAEEANWVSAGTNVFGCGSHYVGKTAYDEPVEGQRCFRFDDLLAITPERYSPDLSSIVQQLGNISISNIPTSKANKQGYSKSNP